MLKKILFLGFAVSILMFSNNLFAEINSVIPLKKPVLSKEEMQALMFLPELRQRRGNNSTAITFEDLK